MNDAYLLDAVRTPFGRYGEGLADVGPDDLDAHVLRTLATRSDLDPGDVDDVVVGAADQAGEDNRNVARMAALLAGWPTSAPWVLPKPSRAFPAAAETLHSTTLGWRLTNPAMPKEWTVSLGESTEILAERYGIGRTDPRTARLRVAPPWWRLGAGGPVHRGGAGARHGGGDMIAAGRTAAGRRRRRRRSPISVEGGTP